MTGIETAIRGLIRGSGATRASVVAGVVGAPRRVLIESDSVFHAASTMKLAVLVELYRRAWAGAVSLDGSVPVRNGFRSIADGSPYALDPSDDSETALYGRGGGVATARELAALMITVSSNLATNLLVDLLGTDRIDARLRDLGVDGVEVRRGVEDGPAFAAGLNNTVTAAGLASLLECIADRSAAPTDACTAMLDLLAQQAFNAVTADPRVLSNNAVRHRVDLAERGARHGHPDATEPGSRLTTSFGHTGLEPLHGS